MDFTLWLAFLLASFIMLVVPGPTILVVMNCVLQHGKKSILPSIAGVAVGDTIAISLSLVGISGLLFILAEFFTLLKWLGAIYLAYLGIMMIKKAQHHRENNDIIPYQQLFRQNFLVTVLNPKSIIFFIAFLPQFIVTHQPIMPQFIVMMLTFVILGSLNAYLYAVFADILREKLTTPHIRTWLSRISGGILCLLAVSLLGYQSEFTS